MAEAILWAVADERRKQRVLSIHRRRLRDSSNALELPDADFMAHFRLSKSGFHQINEELTPFFPVIKRITAISNELKILAALHFFAFGSYQRHMGASYLANMSQPSFSKCLHEVIDALNTREILLRHVVFPSSQRDREDKQKVFMEKFGFPGVIVCVDGTHLALIRPRHHEETFFNRKNYHSLNVQIICDATLNIMHVDASYGGASHDSYIWNQSPIKASLERLHAIGESCWLLGDSGYAQRPWMMTPILGALPGSPEDHYTTLHCRARNTIERCIGVLKARWRCLLAHRVLHYDPTTAAKIVNACVVLHNIANAQNTPVQQLLAEDEHDQHQPQLNDPMPDSNREMLVRRLWEARNIN